MWQDTPLGNLENNKREMAEKILPETLDSFLSSFSENEFVHDFSEFEYHGFDPNITYNVLKKHATDKSKTRDEFKFDMKLLCAVVLMRGTNLIKIMSKSNDDVRNKLQKLKTVYQIERPKKENINNKTIIMSRITATFPQICRNLIIKKSITPKIKIEGLPDDICFNGGVVFIKSNNLDMINKYKQWAIQFDKLINGLNSDEERVINFIEIIMRSNKIPESERPY